MNPIQIDHDPQALAQIQDLVESELVSVRAVTLTSDAARDALTLELRDVLRVKDDVESRMKRATDPLNTALKEIRSWFAPARTALDTLQGALRGELDRYETAKRTEQRAQFAAAQAAAQAGDMPAATTALVAASSAAPTKADGVSTVESWEAAITDPEAVPRAWCAPDERRIRAHAKAAGHSTPAPIPGVTFERIARARISR